MVEIFLDRYEVLDEVGQGGMAVVYRGVDRVLHRSVAIKVLHQHLSSKDEARARFAREARVIAKLRHPNIVEVYDFSDEDSSRSFIVQEFVAGETLAEFLEGRDPLIPEMAAMMVVSIGRALHHAHENGVIHRDVKPENIMVRRDGALKLMDFGIAHVTDMEHLTMTGAIIGSPAHMSPEQVDGKALDARTDVFSLGTLFFLVAAGRLPFMADTASGLLKSIADARVPDIRTIVPGFPDDMYRVLLKMMQRSPESRYQEVMEVVGEIEGITDSLGLDSVTVELPRFFEDPASRTMELRKSVAQRRMVRARAFMRDGAYAVAIRELDVILADDSDDTEARRELDRARSAIRRKALSRTSVVVAIGVGIVMGLALAAYRFLPPMWGEYLDRTTDAGLHTAVSTDALPPVRILAPIARALDEARVMPRRGTATVATAMRIRPAGHDARRVKAAREADREKDWLPVVIHADPPAVRIEVDGRFRGFGTTGSIRLAPGRRNVRLTHPRCDVCKPAEYSFELDPENPLRAPLRYSINYRDALLRVKGPVGAMVLVNGVPRGRTNTLLRVPIRRPTAMEVNVAMQEKGKPALSARALLSPTKTTTVTISGK